ncbi:MAG: H-NS histone family protein [Haliea sp.]|uniref:H-NS histone family protein n=1 Tax=Haliea sp. TaxID=1932666 RepID=UPI0032EDED0D
MKEKNSVFSAYAKSKAKTSAEARRLSIAELEKLIANLNASLATEKAKLKKKESQDRLATIQKVNDLLAESGLKPEDLKKAPRKAGAKRKASAKRAKKARIPPRYRLEIDGREYLWSGRGRTPRVFREYFDAGNSRESCEIVD